MGKFAEDKGTFPPPTTTSSPPPPPPSFLKGPHPWRALLTILLLRMAFLFTVATDRRWAEGTSGCFILASGLTVILLIRYTHSRFKPWASVKSGAFHAALLPVFLCSAAVDKPGRVVPTSDSLKFSGWRGAARTRAISGWMGGEEQALCLQLPFTKVELRSGSSPAPVIFKHTLVDLHSPLS